MKLSELRGRRPDNKPITVRGIETEMRFVPAIESMLMQTAMPRPNTGSTAESQNHPRNRAAAVKWQNRFAALVVGHAIGIHRDNGEGWDESRDQKWCETYADEVLAELSEAEVTRLYGKIDAWLYELTNDTALIGDGERQGN